MAERNGAGANKPVVEEIHFRSEQVYISLVVNRRHRTARIVDFLAGNFPLKQAAIQQIAVREGIKRVYTLVEREESTGWARVGYAREGSITGYYKRSDAYVMGHIVNDPPKMSQEGILLPPVPDVAKAEKALNAAKKLREVIGPRQVRTQLMSDRDIEALRTTAKARKELAAVDDRFGRTGLRFHVTARDSRGTARAAEQVVSAEVQECFGNAYVQISSVLATELDARVLVGALNELSEHLKGREVTSTFAFAPVSDSLVSAAMLAAGYRKTGLLAQHIVLNDQRTDAILWTRKTGAAADAADAA